MAIPFTQYLAPNGTKLERAIERPPEIEAKAQAIIAAGFRFECEMLRNAAPGLPNVSLTISDDERDLAIELCVSGPAVLKAVDRLVSNFTIP